MACLAELEGRMAEFSHHAASPQQVKDLVAAIHAARRILDGFEARVASVAARHAQSGCAPPVEELLAGDGEISRRDARAAARRAEVADGFPRVGAGLNEGRSKRANVDHIARVASALQDPSHQLAFAALDERLAQMAERLSPEQFRAEVDRLVDRIKNDHGLSRFERQRRDSFFRFWTDPRSGMTRTSGAFDPEWGAVVADALDAEMKALATRAAEGDGASVEMGEHLAAEALVEVISRSGRNTASGAGRLRPLVAVIVDKRTLTDGPHEESVSEFWAGSAAAPETVARLCCDSFVQHLVLDCNGLPLRVGRAKRTATQAQRLALRAVYPGCMIPGCDRPFTHCQIHHITPWEEGGTTDIDNLGPLCSHHHHLVHEGQWRLELDRDRTLRLHRPDGVLHAVGRPSGEPKPVKTLPEQPTAVTDGCPTRWSWAGEQSSMPMLDDERFRRRTTDNRV